MNVYVRETAIRMVRAGVAVDVFTVAETARNTELAPQLRVIARPPEREPADFARWAVAHAQSEGVGYDAVFSHYWIAGLAAERAATAWDAPHIAAFHTLAKAKGRSFSGESSHEARVDGEQRIVDRAEMLIAMSPAEQRTLIDDYGADPEAIRIVSPGVDRSLFRPLDRDECRRALGIALDRPVLVFVGRLDPIKGFDVLRDAVRRCRSNPIVLALGGESAQSDRMGIVRVPAVPRDVLPRYFGAADAVVVPSYYESFGLAALEAQACARALAASDVGGLRTLVHDGVNGRLVPPGSPSVLAQLLDELLSDPDSAARLGANGCRNSRLYDWADAADALLRSVPALSGPQVAPAPLLHPAFASP